MSLFFALSPYALLVFDSLCCIISVFQLRYNLAYSLYLSQLGPFSFYLSCVVFASKYGVVLVQESKMKGASAVILT